MQLGEQSLVNRRPVILAANIGKTARAVAYLAAHKQGLTRSACALLLGAVGLQASIGCEANKNYEARQAYANSLPQKDPNCLGQCLPDPGSPLQDCLAEQNEQEYEYLEVWTFDEAGTAPQPFAKTLYSYDDGSIFNLKPTGFEPDSDEIKLCQRATTREWGLNIRGGPFRDWGGGIGTSFIRLNQEGQCRNPDPAAWYDQCPPEGTGYPFNEATIDVSEWDGISLWARRGPNGQPLLRVLLGDKRTDDDISFLMYEVDPDKPRYCERNRECGCPLGQQCTEFYGRRGNHPDPPQGEQIPEGRDSAYYQGTPRPFLPDEPEAAGRPQIFLCWDQDHATPDGAPPAWDNWDYRDCGDYACQQPYTAYPTMYNVQPSAPFDRIVPAEDDRLRADTQYYGRTCEPFAFRGGIEGSFCYEPGVDPDPYESSETCGDHWTYPLHLTTEWKFYRIPFTRLVQQGWAKEQPKLELSAVSALRLTWDKGYVDHWIDDVSFYRRKRPPKPEGAAGASGN